MIWLVLVYFGVAMQFVGPFQTIEECTAARVLGNAALDANAPPHRRLFEDSACVWSVHPPSIGEEPNTGVKT